MILKRQQKDGIIKAIYSSSNICASTYNKETKELVLIFTNGGQYKYLDVSEAAYLRFETADSQGVVSNSHIKSHVTEKLDKVDTKLILNEVSEIKENEDKTKINYAVKMMVEAMRSIVVYYDTTTAVESGLLSKSKEAIANYESIIESKLDKVNG